jgi:hypothetical protein
MVKGSVLLALLIVIGLCALTAGCATQPSGNATPTVTTRATTAPLTTVTATLVPNATATVAPNATPDNTTVLQPLVSIIQPANGASIPRGNVTVIISATHFSIVDKLGEANTRGEGHVHYYLDATSIPTASGTPAIPANGTYAAWAPVAGTSHTFTNVTPGTHTFTVQLVNNDHTPYVPPATANSTVTVSS